MPVPPILSISKPAPYSPVNHAKEPLMKLGAFSISLAVKDIAVSRAFYEKLGFSVFGGNQDERWLILKNETATVGLFQGMFEKNMLTFNPGWTVTPSRWPTTPTCANCSAA